MIYEVSGNLSSPQSFAINNRFMEAATVDNGKLDGNVWTLPAGQARATAAASSSGRAPRSGDGGSGGSAGTRGLGPGSGLPVEEDLSRDGAAEAMVAMSSLEGGIDPGGDGATLTEPAELERELDKADRSERPNGSDRDRRGWLGRLRFWGPKR